MIVPALAAGVLLFGGTTTKVGVICVGSDPALTGSAQRGLEMRLAQVPGTTVRGAAAIAPVLGVKQMLAQPVDPVAQKRAADLIEAASKAYYEDKLVDALDKLSAAGAIQERTAHVPTGERVRLILWRTAVLLGLNDADKAATEARSALVLAPDLKVDLTVFRPSVAKLVEEVRKKGLPQATILFEGVPPGAEVVVDDRPMNAERATLPIGKHRLAVKAPGFHEMERTMDVTGDAAVAVGMPLALDPGVERSIAAIAYRGDAGPDVANLQKLAERIDVDGLIIVASRTDPASDARAFAWWSSAPQAASDVAPASADGISTLTEWAAARVAEAGRALASAIPTPMATPVPTHRPPRQPRQPSAPGSLSADGGLAICDRARQVKGSNGGGFSSGFGGAGPLLHARYSKSGIQGDLEIAFITYAFSKLDANLPTAGQRQTIDGGSDVRARVAAGYEATFGGQGADGYSVTGLLGYFYDSHAGKDLVDPTQGAQGIFPSETFGGVEVRAIAGIPAGPARIQIGLGALPVTSWSESPSGSTGTSPKAGLAPEWQLGAAWAPADGWKISGSYQGMLRNASFTGPVKADLAPKPSDAKVTETLHTFVISAQRSF